MNVNGSQIHSPSAHSPGTPHHDGLPPYLTVAQVSAVTTLARSSIYNRMNDPKDPLPRPLRAGRRVMWSRDEVLAYMKARADDRDRAAAQRKG